MTPKTEEKPVEAPWDDSAKMPDEVRRDIDRRAKLERLRAPFDARAIGKLPRATSKDAKPGRCKDCGGWHKLPAVHLDYVGHAGITDRLLSVDPEWDWQPVAWDENGLPRFVRAAGGNPVGLWIRLTVLGVTRLGYGSVEGGAFDAEKQLIGDALRNAAMRFGVALSLWDKAELESSLGDDEAVDVKTGEVIPMSSRDEGDRMVKEIEQWEFAPEKNRVIEGIPIHCSKDWKAVSTATLGGKSPFANMTFGKILDQEEADERDALEYFELTVIPAVRDLWNRMTPAKKAKGLDLNYECALIAYGELMNRRAPSPFEGDAS